LTEGGGAKTVVQIGKGRKGDDLPGRHATGYHVKGGAIPQGGKEETSIIMWKRRSKNPRGEGKRLIADKAKHSLDGKPGRKNGRAS